MNGLPMAPLVRYAKYMSGPTARRIVANCRSIGPKELTAPRILRQCLLRWIGTYGLDRRPGGPIIPFMLHSAGAVGGTLARAALVIWGFTISRRCFRP